MMLKLVRCGKTSERSGSFEIVVADELGREVSASMTERNTGGVFVQYGAIVEELVTMLLAGLNSLEPVPVPVPEPVAAPETTRLGRLLSTPPGPKTPSKMPPPHGAA